MPIEFANPYEFQIQEYRFGDLPQHILKKLFVDGRVVSKFLERHIPIWFKELTFVDKVGYDFIHEDRSHYEAKCFTKSGLNYSASKYQGVGRKIDLKEHAESSKNTNYILCDVVSFPCIRIVFLKGSTLLSRYPTGLIKYDQRTPLFSKQSSLFDRLSCGNEEPTVE
jgi:hypothetical protein